MTLTFGIQKMVAPISTCTGGCAADYKTVKLLCSAPNFVDPHNFDELNNFLTASLSKISSIVPSLVKAGRASSTLKSINK